MTSRLACSVRLSGAAMPVHLFDLADGHEIGIVTDAQFEFLEEHLEAEDADDDDYYLNQTMLDGLQQQGADGELIALLRSAMAGRDEVDIRWQRDEQDAGASGC
jgi:hypothetical protein